MAEHHGICIHHTPVLAERTSIRLGGAAIAEVEVVSREGIERLPEVLNQLGGNVALLGAGTNILAGDGALPFVLVKMNASSLPEIIGEEAGYILVAAGAGTRLPALLRFCAEKGLSGLEGLCGIPGCVGGAVAMNAGSYGTSISDRLKSVEVFSPTAMLQTCAVSNLAFAYRSCRWPGHDEWFLVTGVTLALKPASCAAVRNAMAEVIDKKKRTQPVTAKSAGCVFKNISADLPTGKALDLAGCRGMRLGGMAFSSMHANFLINEGNGSFAAAEELIGIAKERVFAQFGATLELEVKLWQ